MEITKNNTIITDCYGEINIIESNFWGLGDNGEKITTIINLTTLHGELECDLYVNDELLVKNTTLYDVGNELDYHGVQKIC